MRLRSLAIGSALTAVLALVALPGFAGSHVTRDATVIPVSAFQPLSIPAPDQRSTESVAGPDAGYVSAGVGDAWMTFEEPGDPPAFTGPTSRVISDQPEPDSGSARRPPKYTLSGEATFYDAGHTAMRLPRGTTVVICGAGGCIERVVNDYGPQKASRIVDLYRPDFFKICGCPSWSGVTDVTVRVY